jgi:hypothetical protein
MVQALIVLVVVTIVILTSVKICVRFSWLSLGFRVRFFATSIREILDPTVGLDTPASLTDVDLWTQSGVGL